jgi:GT2 family glycosyltransferase
VTARLAVALCTFERPALLRRALASLDGQLPAGARLLVVDNASADDTAEVVRAFPFAAYHRNPRNLGMVGNWNRAAALLEAEGAEYGAVIHDDDEHEPGALAALLAALAAAPSAAFAHAGVTLVDPAGAVLGRPPLPAAGLRPGAAAALEIARTGACPYHAPTVMFRAAALRRAGPFSEDFRLAADLDMWGRLALEGDVVGVAARLLRYRVHPAGGTAGTTLVTYAAECREVQRRLGRALAARGLGPLPSPAAVEARYLGRLALSLAVRYGARAPGDEATRAALAAVRREGTALERAWAGALLLPPVRGALGLAGAAARRLLGR